MNLKVSLLQLLGFAFLVCGALGIGFGAPIRAHLRTQQTSITVEAFPNAPRLTILQGEGGDKWINGMQESLLPFAWLNGKRVPLLWKLDASASHSDTHTVTYVFKATPVPLRLSWVWQVRTNTGPIEHRIQIQNLSQQEIWIPMQDSFRFSWR
ncbi:MAG: hypothetical protein V4587_04645, partial [Acidobacteriota bacterium]